jgi:hypothetical protein
VHQWVKLKIEAGRAAGTYGDLRTQCSVVETSVRAADHGTAGSTRLDVIEDRRPESDMVCVYDIKTGRAGLSPERLLQIGLEVNKHFDANLLREWERGTAKARKIEHLCEPTAFPFESGA